jgi:serine/threonine protein kinase
MHLDIGEVIKGVFRVCEVKHGGMGDVYVCDVLDGDGGPVLNAPPPAALEERRRLGKPSGRKMAFKSVSTDFFLSGENQSRFEREALIWTTIAPHPYIIASRSVDRYGVAPVIMLDYAAGGNLRERLADGPLSVEETLRTARQTCIALAYLAATGILHRDLKPENVLFDDSGDVKITDFGLSSLRKYALDRASVEEGSEGRDVSGERFVGGTLPYMSPEHFGEGRFTSASDVYSFGVIMFELLEGRLPFDRPSFESFRDAHLHAAPQSVSTTVAPADFCAVIARCLEKNPDKRFADFVELDDTLAAIAANNKLEVSKPLMPTAEELEHGLESTDWNQRGYAFGTLRHYEDSLRAYERALELAPMDVGAHINVGTALARLDRNEEALEFHEKEVELHPELPVAHAVLGATYANDGRNEDAAAQLELAAKGDPTELRFMRELCGIYRRLDRDDDFNATVSRVVAVLTEEESQYGPVGWTNEGLHFGLMYEFDASLKIFDATVARYPEFVDGWYNRAVTLLCLRRADDALESVQQAVRLMPQAPQALFLEGVLQVVCKETHAAQIAWETLITAHPSHRFATLAGPMLQLSTFMPEETLAQFILEALNVPNDLYYRA